MTTTSNEFPSQTANDLTSAEWLVAVQHAEIGTARGQRVEWSNWNLYVGCLLVRADISLDNAAKYAAKYVDGFGK